MDNLVSNGVNAIKALQKLLNFMLQNALIKTKNNSVECNDSNNEAIKPLLSLSDILCEKNLILLLEYIDDRILASLEPKPENNLNDQEANPIDEKTISILVAWNDVTNKLYDDLFTFLIQGYQTINLTTSHWVILSQLIIMYSLKSSVNEDIVELVITCLDASDQSDIQYIIEEFEKLYSDNDSALSSEGSMHRQKVKVPMLDFSRLNSRAEEMSSIENETISIKSSHTVSSEDFFSNQSDALPVDSSLKSSWKKKYITLKKVLNEVEGVRETLQKRNEELEDIIKNKNSTLQGSFIDNRHTTEKDVQSIFGEIYRLEEQVEHMKIKLEQTIKEKNEIEKSSAAEIRLLKDQIQVHKADSDEVIRLKMSLEKYTSHLKELSLLKNKNQQLYKSVQDYLNQIVQLNEQVASITELKHSNDLYKKKLNELTEENLHKSLQLEESKKQIALLKKELESAHSKRQQTDEQLCSVQKEFQDKMSQFVSSDACNETYQEKENQILRERNESHDVNALRELQFQLEEMTFSKNALESEYKKLLEKVQHRQDNDVSNDVPTADSTRTQENTSISPVNSNESFKQSIQILKDQLKSETTRRESLERTIKEKIECEHQSFFGSLQEQIASLTNQLKIITLARNEEILIHRREEKVMSIIFHQIGTLMVELNSKYQTALQQLSSSSVN
ncbi:protein Hook homolog 1-like isoform X2 [Hylaeus volcanicus]|uniref:protein Hook homolog 1-like isoform X2 n=1 Tax=Hylaeus volcanicus TaxID=313075 RepID=UPI0023B83EDF|nr:protein Hook homolog 1-like isoform X2 [Hylaeus volcanicus]